MEIKTLVAIEIASSKIKGAVATVAPTGQMTVLAVEELPMINSVRYGRVQNIKEVSAAVNEVILKLENHPKVAPRKVQSIILSLGGRSLGSSPESTTITLPNEIEITESVVQRLKDEAVKDFTGNKNVETVLPRSYYVNNELVKSVVGTVGSTLRGEFLLVTCARENRENLNRLSFNTVTADNVNIVIRQIAIADAVLSEADKQLGCALVDFGAETTTISVYKNGTLASLATLPMGSRLITMDLMSGLTLTESVAENFKLTLGSLGDAKNAEGNAEEINNYVSARADEIAANIVNLIGISSGKDNLGNGIVLVGGGAKLPKFEDLLASHSQMKVNKGTMPELVDFADKQDNTTDNIDVVSLLLSGRNIQKTEGLSIVEGEVLGLDIDETDTQIDESQEKDIVVEDTKDGDDDDLLEDDFIEENNSGDGKSAASKGFRDRLTKIGSTLAQIFGEVKEEEDEEE